MPDLSIYATTFNAGRQLASTAYLAPAFFNALTTALPPDLIVLSLQEIAPLGYAFLGGSLLAPYFARFRDIVATAADKTFGAEVQYETLMVRTVGLTGVMVFGRREAARKVRWKMTAGVGVGVMELGNKGAVGVRVALEGGGGDGDEEELVMTFVAAHLAPHESAVNRRNEDWKSICEGLVFETEDQASSPPSSPTSKSSSDATNDNTTENDRLLPNRNPTQHTLFNPPTNLLFLGDLNYRTSTHPPDPASHKTWPQPHNTPDHSSRFLSFLEHDQLNRERQALRTLHNLDEAGIGFGPTYKYSSAAQQAAQKNTSFDGDNEYWAKHRYPSWCDRILYLAASPPKVHGYVALPVQPTSDHRPVAMSCSVPWAQVPDVVKLEAPFVVKDDWRARRAAARRLEVLVGLAAYLGWTWEGEMVLLGTMVGLVGGWVLLKGLIAG